MKGGLILQFGIIVKCIFLNVNLNIDYEILSNLHFAFDANYWLYVLKDKAVPYHKPMLEFRFDGRYTLKEKFGMRMVSMRQPWPTSTKSRM